ncbi:MAG TPA: UvrD-helicase domain-containing protein [Steroidobacteraceae bacterium]|nr:UvrD-helicase domain-containing protein [Steroidobacteraceae bacterium]
MTDFAPADQDTREAALDPTRSFIVEAPAGSGKTELLTRRYLRLLACVQAPEEVLAITFTRKAAAEMRARVLHALASAANDQPPQRQSKHAVWELARAVRVVDADRSWNLATHPARLRIMTIDAFNSSLARQLPLLSGAGATLAIADDADALYAEVALRISERLGTREPVADCVARLLRHLDNQFEIFERLLSNELKRREYWLDLGLLRFGVETMRPRLEQTLEQVVTHELAALCRIIPRDIHPELVALASHAAGVLGSDSKSAIVRCAHLKDLPATSGDAINQWRGLAELLLTGAGTLRVQITKNIGFPSDDKATKQRFFDLLQQFASIAGFAEAMHRVRALPSARYSDEQWQVLTDLLEVLKVAIAELEVVIRERGEADHVANAIAARRALGSVSEPTDLALRLDYRLQHILVDEFQDTSQGQIELLALLTAGWNEGDGRTLFCVGDPMQSIYRFRNADVGLFLTLKQLGLNELRLTPLRLTVNFRSALPVLTWVNRVFAQTLPSLDDPHQGAVSFTSSEARVDASQEGGIFVHAIVGEKEDVRRAEATRVADLLIAIGARRPDASIALLVSSRRHLRWIMRELRARAIEFQAVDFDPLRERPAIQDLIALTRAVVHLADRTAWLAILRAPWCGLTLSDLHTLCVDAAPQATTIWQLLNDQERTARISTEGRERIARMRPLLEVALANRGRMSLRECVELTWHGIGGPGTVTDEGALLDASAYFARLERIERNGDLEDIVRLDEQLKDLYATSSPRNGKAKIELMTIHRAKGLEFDVVILPALDSGARDSDSPILRAQEVNADAKRELLLAPIAARGADKDSIYSWLELTEKERGRYERGRLLYVAATRARSELHLFGAVAPEAQPRANTFLNTLWPVVESDFAKVEATLPTSESAVRMASTRRLPLTWQPPAPAESIGKSTIKDVSSEQALYPEFEWVSETGRHVGTLVHREIERLSRSSRDLDALNIAGNRVGYQVELAELGVPLALRTGAADRVVEALERMVNDERGRWLLAGDDTHRDVASELALSGLSGTQIRSVVIDRTFLTRDGTRWIVDFKTSMHEGGGLEEFLSSEEERYREQLQRYASLMRAYKPSEPVKAALYFPLLRVWREVSLE